MSNLSLILACYNEEPHLKRNLQRVLEVLEKSRYPYEIVMVNDCSTDQTMSILENFKSTYKGRGSLQLIKHQENQGRGESVKDGIIAARGSIAGFVDIDLSTSPWYILPLSFKIEQGADIALGSRMYKLKWKVLHRWILSKGYKILVRIFLGIDLGDTETGCKFFNRERIIPVLHQVKDRRWFWDTEVMVRSHIADLKIVDIPTVFVRESLYSRVKIIRDSWRHLVNLVRLSRETRKIIQQRK